jgi:hypothetical protein
MHAMSPRVPIPADEESPLDAPSCWTFQGLRLKKLIRRDNHANVYEVAVVNSLLAKQLIRQQRSQQKQKLRLEARVYNFEGVTGTLLKARKRNLTRLAASRAIVEATVQTQSGEKRTVVIYKTDQDLADVEVEVDGGSTSAANGDVAARKSNNGKAARQRKRRRVKKKEGQKDDNSADSRSISIVQSPGEVNCDASASPTSRKKPTRDGRVVEFLATLLGEKDFEVNPNSPTTLRTPRTVVHQGHHRLTEWYHVPLKLYCGFAQNLALEPRDDSLVSLLSWWRSQTVNHLPCPFPNGLDTVAKVQTMLGQVRLDQAFLAKMQQACRRLLIQALPLPGVIPAKKSGKAPSNSPKESRGASHRSWLFERGKFRIAALELVARSIETMLETDLVFLSFRQKVLQIVEMSRHSDTDTTRGLQVMEELKATLQQWLLCQQLNFRHHHILWTAHWSLLGKIMGHTISRLKSSQLDGSLKNWVEEACTVIPN